MTASTIEIDGTLGEGGGQILRTSLALSLVTGRPFHLRHIRAKRPKPGLQPQHLQCVLAASRIGNASIRGASLGSTDLVFEPGPVVSGHYQFHIGTAGATGLVLHTIYLPLILSGQGPSEITLTGGTHVKTSPTFPFLAGTWLAYLETMGLKVSLQLDRPGFFPRGGGIVQAFLQPSQRIKALTLGERQSALVSGISAVAGLDGGIARRQARRAQHQLGHAGQRVTIAEESWDGGPGTFLQLRVDTGSIPAVFVALGERGKPAEKVADEAVQQVKEYLSSPELVDAHSADQLLLPLALAKGPSEYRTTQITRHLTTNREVIGYFLDRPIYCEGAEGEPGRVRIC
ncbi:MAG: RNA 3'-terminal phosphate cyclase [Gemmataceae bacterium]